MGFEHAATAVRRRGVVPFLLGAGVLLMGGCSTVPVAPPPIDLNAVPDAVPRLEPFGRSGNPESYEQNGQRYWVLNSPWGYASKGIASWYGKKFHGRRTSSGDTYDMYAMTAAHKTLPIPCYARVTNLENGRSVVVKINDRGPFIDGRIVDLSYVAAHKLGMVEKGTAQVELQVIDTRGDYATQYAQQRAPAMAPPATARGLPSELPSRPVYGEVIPAPSPKPPAVERTSLAAAGAASASRIAAKPTTRAIDGGAQIASEARPVVASPPVIAQPSSKATRSGMSNIPQGVYLQLGAYSSAANANAERRKLEGLQSTTVQVEKVSDSLGILYRVMVGPMPNNQVAKELGSRLMTLGWDQHRVVTR